MFLLPYKVIYYQVPGIRTRVSLESHFFLSTTVPLLFMFQKTQLKCFFELAIIFLNFLTINCNDLGFQSIERRFSCQMTE